MTEKTTRDEPIEWTPHGATVRYGLRVTSIMTDRDADERDLVSALSAMPTERRLRILEQLPEWRCQECGLKEGRRNG